MQAEDKAPFETMAEFNLKKKLLPFNSAAFSEYF